MKKILLSMAIFATLAGLMFVTSCKKQQTTFAGSNNAISEQSVSPNEQKIVDFIGSYSSFKSGAKVEGDPVGVNDARWQWETTFNYCYGFTQSHLLNMRSDTVLVRMPHTDGDGNISYSDLLETYGVIVDAVRETYAGIEMDAKTLQFVMMEIENGNSKDGDNVRVVMNTGSEVDDIDSAYMAPWYGIPFVFGECYVWGSMGPLSTTNNAAYQIQNKIEIYDANHSYYYVPCPNCYTYIENPNVVIDEQGNAENDSLFYAEGLTREEAETYQICWNDLNKYYAYIMQLGHYEGMQTNAYNVDWYYKTLVFDGFCGTVSSTTIFHGFKIMHCTRQWRQYNSEYPISVDNEE